MANNPECCPFCRGKWNPDCLMIDEMVSQLGDGVERLWKRDEGGTGKYPPSSLHVRFWPHAPPEDSAVAGGIVPAWHGLGRIRKFQ